jgi:hypothetical protein
MEAEEQERAPTGQYRHATYIIRDPFQEQVIAETRIQQPASASTMQVCQQALFSRARSFVNC